MAAYKEMIYKKINGVYQAGIATKILQHMDNNRNHKDLSQARRWVMELLQNARDVAYEGRQVRVRITLDEDSHILKFEHSGRPFRIKDVLSIINQVSSKSEDNSTVGKFGTGFIQTYLLSETVNLSSILSDSYTDDNGNTVRLPMKRFSIKLDRSGKSEREITSEIDSAMSQLAKVDENEDLLQIDEDAYNTCFSYELTTADSRETARTGIEDLINSVIYVMLFSNGIGEITTEIQSGGKSSRVRYERVMNNISGRFTIKITDNGIERKSTLRYVQDGALTIAAPVDDNGNFVPIPDMTPRLYIDFPLVGSEKFPFPVAVGSRGFLPNEPRSGITLVDNQSSVDAAANKGLMKKVVDMFRDLLAAAVQEKNAGIKNMINIPAFKPDPEISAAWVNENIYRRLFSFIENEPIFGTKEGYLPLSDKRIYVMDCRPDERRTMVELVSSVKGCTVPDDDVDWYGILKKYDIAQDRVLTLERLAKNAGKLMPPEDIAWCRRLYDLCMGNPEMETKIKAGEIEIFPSQDAADIREGKLLTINGIHKDPGIPEQLKAVCDVLDSMYGNNNMICIRKHLLADQFGDPGISEMTFFNMDTLQGYIERNTDADIFTLYSGYSDNDKKIQRHAQCMMAACGPDEETYRLCIKMHESEETQRNEIQGYDEKLWINSYKGIIERLVNQIECAQMTVDTDTESEWLTRLIEKAVQYYSARYISCRNIFPDQRGNRHRGEDLCTDDINDDTLHDITESFADINARCDLSARMLDRNILVPEGIMGRMTIADAAALTNSAVQIMLSRKALPLETDEHQKACTMLLSWIRDNEADAKMMFPAFAGEEEQMKLLTPKAATMISKKARRFEKLLRDFDCEDAEALEKMIKMSSQKKESGSFEYGDLIYDQSFYDYADENGYDKDEYFRKIGECGEKYAYEQLINEVLKADASLTVSRKDDNQCILRASGSEVDDIVIDRPDTANYKQPGWDIRLNRRNPESAEEKYESFYYEVKTHTDSSVLSDVVKLSEEQMKAAIKECERYAVLKVVFDYRNMNGTGMSCFRNPVEHIGNGGFIHNGGYEFIVAAGADEMVA